MTKKRHIAAPNPLIGNQWAGLLSKKGGGVSLELGGGGADTYQGVAAGHQPSPPPPPPPVGSSEVDGTSRPTPWPIETPPPVDFRPCFAFGFDPSAIFALFGPDLPIVASLLFVAGGDKGLVVFGLPGASCWFSFVGIEGTC
jgi:hypothetical protein